MARKSTRPEQVPVLALTRWRESQCVYCHAAKKQVVMSITAAAKKFSEFFGRVVPYQTWWAWERGGRIPDEEYMRALNRFTGGIIRADHFYHLADDASDEAA